MQPRNPLLRERVASIDVIEASGEAFVFPSTTVVLGMQARGRVRAGETFLTPAGVTGVQPTARTYSYAPQTSSILVRFTAQGASCLGVPVQELAGKNVALDTILSPSRVEEASERLRSAKTNSERVAVVEELMAGLAYVADPLVARAIVLLDRVTNEGGIAAVAKSLGKSERQLERRFLQRVGVTPKRFAMLRRFERAVALAKRSPSLTAAALDAGYFDQSHFIRDFRQFTGKAPGALLMSESSNSRVA